MSILFWVAACVGLWFLLPRAFGFFVGLFVGLTGGGLAWGLVAMAWPVFNTGADFVGFVGVGMLLGFFVAAKG